MPAVVVRIFKPNSGCLFFREDCFHAFFLTVMPTVIPSTLSLAPPQPPLRFYNQHLLPMNDLHFTHIFQIGSSSRGHES